MNAIYIQFVRWFHEFPVATNLRMFQETVFALYLLLMWIKKIIFIKSGRFVDTKFEKLSDEFDFRWSEANFGKTKRVRLHFGSIVWIINFMEEYEQDCKVFQSARLCTKKFSTNQWPSDKCVRQCLVSAQIRPGLDTALWHIGKLEEDTRQTAIFICRAYPVRAGAT